MTTALWIIALYCIMRTTLGLIELWRSGLWADKTCGGCGYFSKYRDGYCLKYDPSGYGQEATSPACPDWRQGPKGVE